MLHLSPLNRELAPVASDLLLPSMITISYLLNLLLDMPSSQAHWGSHKWPVSTSVGHALVQSNNQCLREWSEHSRLADNTQVYLLFGILWLAVVWGRIPFPLCERTVQHETPTEMGLARRNNTQKEPQTIYVLDKFQSRVFMSPIFRGFGSPLLTDCCIWTLVYETLCFIFGCVFPGP